MASIVNQFNDNILEVSRLERELVDKEFKSGNRQAAWDRLYQAVLRLLPRLNTPEYDTALINAVLEISNISIVLGKGFGDLIQLLQTAQQAAQRIGDRRSHAMINFHLGRLHHFGGNRLKALELFALGKVAVEELNDEDIIDLASEFIGFYFFFQGSFREAQPYFERAAHSYETESSHRVINPSGTFWLSYCYAYLGEFHRAIGTADYYRRLALDRADTDLATTLQATLGVILSMIRRSEEASYHLTAAHKNAESTHNMLALYFAKGGRAFNEFQAGNLTHARDLIEDAIKTGIEFGLNRLYSTPLTLELLFQIHFQKIPAVQQFDFQREYQRALSYPNFHLRGVALRLKAIETVANNGDLKSTVEPALLLSEENLKRSGDPIQLAKTYLEMVRLYLKMKDLEKARELARKAWKSLSGYADVFYPDDLRPLLSGETVVSSGNKKDKALLASFMEMIKELVPTTDVTTLLNQTVAATNRFFKAERGALFWFNDQQPNKAPELRGSHNISHSDVQSEKFRSSLTLVFKVYHEKKPRIVRKNAPSFDGGVATKAILCVPIKVEEQVQGVLYHDNSYMEDCFDDYGKSELVLIANSLNDYLMGIENLKKTMDANAIIAMTELGLSDTTQIITCSPTMQTILDQTTQIAETDSTILILGETGVGKELMAKRIYTMSARKDKPFVILDPTTISENLLESELFGHEKGAFTGADRQKKGRLELADQGTLFIDEIGEIPKSAQVKFLRAIQEKTIVRVGGTKSISTDFRLIVATNRDLAREVADGRLREDLYYRLNIVPLILPPLRNRIDDVPLLAQHFLNRYTVKYNRPRFELSGQNKAKLMRYQWPGNVRELQNIIERGVLLSKGEHLSLDLPSSQPALSSFDPFADMPNFEEMQRRYLEYVLEKTDGKISGPGGAAEILEMKYSTLYNCLIRLGLRSKKSATDKSPPPR